MGFLLWSIFLSTIGTVSAITHFNALVGGTTFLSSTSPASPDQQIDWNLDASGSVIATRRPGIDSTYAGRCVGGKCTLFANGTLRMDQLLVSDNRSYTVTLRTGGVQFKEQVQLNVYNLLTPPSLILSSTIRPVNGTNLNLRCNAGTQTVHSIYFYRNQELVSCSSPHLSCSQSNSYLYFSPILASDSGDYSCGIQNPVSSNRSTSINLNVAVNVSRVNLYSNSTQPVIAEKETVSLICSSYGTDVSNNWMLMGSPLPQNPRYSLINNNSILVISPVSRSDQGAFTCRVSNYLNSEISNPFNLTWSPDGHIECGAERLAQSVELYCLWPGGYPPAVVHLVYENIIQSGLDGTTAAVPSYRFSLGKLLSCTGTHAGSSETCSLAIDTPQSAGFINDSLKTAKTGSSAFLSITLNGTRAGAAEIFPAKFSWSHLDPSASEITEKNIYMISNDYSSILIVPYMSNEFNGQYVCKAENRMGSNSFTFILNVKEEEILSEGAIAGIVIGSVAAVALVALVLVLIFRNRSKSDRQNIGIVHNIGRPCREQVALVTK
ncbi:pregnancy-specific beta-1-glycoprotein 9-like [Rhinoderma darwinii]|uniref:pregnancy-specific beta-1-glycoprotein 9-like n=1 Tax=Rhinoderma darwinii TaxID=43563 RepID=UPI003F6791AB